MPFLDPTNPGSPFICDTPVEKQIVDAQKSFEDSITMVSTYNKVEKIDCEGKLLETAIEEAGAPRVLVSAPAPEIPETAKVLGVKITNLRTCKSLIIDPAKNDTRPTIDVYVTGPNGERLPFAPDPLLAKDLSVQFVGEYSILQIGSIVPLSEGVNIVTVAYQDCASCESPKTLYTTALKINVKREVDKMPRKTVRRSVCRPAN